MPPNTGISVRPLTVKLCRRSVLARPPEAVEVQHGADLAEVGVGEPQGVGVLLRQGVDGAEAPVVGVALLQLEVHRVVGAAAVAGGEADVAGVPVVVVQRARQHPERVRPGDRVRAAGAGPQARVEVLPHVGVAVELPDVVDRRREHRGQLALVADRELVRIGLLAVGVVVLDRGGVQAAGPRREQLVQHLPVHGGARAAVRVRGAASRRDLDQAEEVAAGRHAVRGTGVGGVLREAGDERVDVRRVLPVVVDRVSQGLVVEDAVAAPQHRPAVAGEVVGERGARRPVVVVDGIRPPEAGRRADARPAQRRRDPDGVGTEERVVVVGDREDLEVVAESRADRQPVRHLPLVLRERLERVELRGYINWPPTRTCSRSGHVEKSLALNGMSESKMKVPFWLPWSRHSMLVRW